MGSINKINGSASDTLSKVNGTNDAVLCNMLQGGGNSADAPYFSSHSVDLNGSSNYIDLANSVNEVSTASGGISIWAKLDAASANAYLIQIASDTSVSNNRIILYYNNGNSKISYSMKYGGEAIAYNWASTGIEGDGAWHHIAMFWNPNAEAGTDMYACFDGLCQDAITCEGSFAGTVSAMMVGSATTSGSAYWDGHINEIALWNTSTEGHDPLNAAAIAEIYNNRQGMNVSKDYGNYVQSVSLTGYWKCEENTGTSLTDSSTNSNAGTLSHSSLYTTDTI